jgi:hypothetical protein
MQFMKKIITIALIGTFSITSPLYAQSQNDENIKTDVQNLDKDNQALQEKNDNLNKDRAAKAIDKANDENGKQAVDSVKIGADKVGIEAKTLEKNMDEKTLADHKANINQDEAGKQQ